jgi:hypothetical protein
MDQFLKLVTEHAALVSIGVGLVGLVAVVAEARAFTRTARLTSTLVAHEQAANFSDEQTREELEQAARPVAIELASRLRYPMFGSTSRANGALFISFSPAVALAYAWILPEGEFPRFESALFQYAIVMASVVPPAVCYGQPTHGLGAACGLSPMTKRKRPRA